MKHISDIALKYFGDVAEVADAVGQTPQAIRKAIKTGRIKEGRDCIRYGKGWMILMDVITRYYDMSKAFYVRPKRKKAK